MAFEMSLLYKSCKCMSSLLTIEVYDRVKTVCDLIWYTTSHMMGGLSYQSFPAFAIWNFNSTCWPSTQKAIIRSFTCASHDIAENLPFFAQQLPTLTRPLKRFTRSEITSIFYVWYVVYFCDFALPFQSTSSLLHMEQMYYCPKHVLFTTWGRI